MGRKRVGKGRKKKTPWWNDEVKSAVKLKNKNYRKWMKTRTEEARREYINARNNAEETKRRSKDATWHRIGVELREDMKGSRKLLYGMAKGMRRNNEPETHVILDKEGETLLDEGEVAERWRECFDELLNVLEGGEEEMEEPDLEPGLELEDAEVIEMEEVREAIRALKNGKSTGCDGLNNELYKAGEGMINWMTKLINNIWSEERIPTEWRKAIVCSIHKKGDRRECGNYRGIVLLVGASKIYERILERRLRRIVEDKFGEWQHGFRSGRSTTDLIFYMRMLTEKTIEWSDKVFVTFIDLEKAFDRIERRRRSFGRSGVQYTTKVDNGNKESL